MKTLGGLLILYSVAWSGLTVLLGSLPVPASVSELQHRLLLFVCLGLYIFLAASLSRRLITEVMQSAPHHLLAVVLFASLLFLLLLGFSRALAPPPLLAGVQTALLLFAATVAGALLSTAVKRIGELVPLCCTAAIADLTSVAFGPTSVMVDDISGYYAEGMVGPPPLVDSILIKAGMPGYTVPLPLFGVTDWLLVALLSASLFRLQKNDNLLPEKLAAGGSAFFPASALGLYASLIIAWTANVFIPAMVAMVLVFLAFLVLRYDVLRKMQRKDVVYCFLLPLSVLVAMVIFSQYKSLT